MTNKSPCFKCNGSGSVSFKHIANGVCFQCSGTGNLTIKNSGVKFTPVAPIIDEAIRSTDKQWALLVQLSNDNDATCRNWVKAAGLTYASQIYVTKADMSRVINIALGKGV
jgi:hypothetical protein